jgi:hypothetical protein
VPEPSAQDTEAAWDTLEQNVHMPVMVVGVVTDDRPDTLPLHRLPLGNGQLSVRFVDRLAPETLKHGSAAVVGDEAAFVRALHERMPAAALGAVLGRRVAVFGAGSLGSTIAELLTRNGVGALHIVDHDAVEAVNLSRSTFTMRDLGRPKVDALADRLQQINPLVDIGTTRARLGDDTLEDLTEVVAWADLVVAVTDDPRGQAMLDHLLQVCDKPGVFAGVHAGGQKGEMVLVLPGVTTCYRCAAGQHRLAAQPDAVMDYATGRRTGSVALGADVNTVATITARTVLGVLGLQHGDDSALLAPVLEGRTMVQIGLSADAFQGYGAFDATPAQHQFQSLWLWPEPQAGCPHCVGSPISPPAGLATPDAQASSRPYGLRRWIRSRWSRLRRVPTSTDPAASVRPPTHSLANAR